MHIPWGKVISVGFEVILVIVLGTGALGILGFWVWTVVHAFQAIMVKLDGVREALFEKWGVT